MARDCLRNRSKYYSCVREGHKASDCKIIAKVSKPKRGSMNTMTNIRRNRDDQNLHAVQYMSGKTNPCEEFYHSYEYEILAIIKALKK